MVLRFFILKPLFSIKLVMKYVYNVVLCVLLVLTLFSCERDKCLNVYYRFEVPAELTPAQDTFHIGDTITVRSIFPEEVFERRSGEYYELIDWEFYVGTALHRIDTIVPEEFDGILHSITPWTTPIIDNSKYNYELFQYSDGGNSLTGFHEYIDGAYRLEFKLVVERKGTYFLEQITYLEDFRQDFIGRCGDSGSRMKMNMNEGADNNSYLLYTSPNEFYSNQVTSRLEGDFHDNGGYCFVVVE